MYKLFQMNGSRKSSLGTFAGVEEAKDAATQRVEGTIEWRDDLRATVDGDLFFGLMIKEEDKPEPQSAKPKWEGWKHAPRRQRRARGGSGNSHEEVEEDIAIASQPSKPNDAVARDIDDPDHFLNR